MLVHVYNDRNNFLIVHENICLMPSFYRYHQKFLVQETGTHYIISLFLELNTNKVMPSAEILKMILGVLRGQGGGERGIWVMTLAFLGLFLAPM